MQSFHPLNVVSSTANSDDLMWDIDTPESPDSVLTALMYWNDQTGGAQQTVDISKAVFSFDLDLSQLDTFGGHVTFWFTTYQGRFHFDQPILHGLNAFSVGASHQSWARDNGSMTQAADLGAVESWGFALIGFNQEPLGTFAFDDFTFIARTAEDDENIVGTHADDELFGLAGADLIWGLEGDDHFFGGAGADILTGGVGNDTVSYEDSLGGVKVLLSKGGRKGDAEGDLYGSIERLIGSQLDDELFGDNADNTISGMGGNDNVYGETGDDILDGGDGFDKLDGQDGNDTLIGGLGQDRLVGGAGADLFVMTSLSDSLLTAADEIVEFTSSHGDKIDLQTIDADATAGGDQAFTFIGGGAFTNTAGELHYIGQFLEGDVDGNGTADFRIQLNVWSLANTDFIL